LNSIQSALKSNDPHKNDYTSKDLTEHMICWNRGQSQWVSGLPKDKKDWLSHRKGTLSWSGFLFCLALQFWNQTYKNSVVI